MTAEYVLAPMGVSLTIRDTAGKPIIKRIGMRSLESAMSYAESVGVPPYDPSNQDSAQFHTLHL